MLRQYYLMRTSPARLLPMFAWVAIDIVLWGFISRYLSSVTNQDFVPKLLGAVLFWDFFTRVMQGVTTAFFEDVWSRNFLNVFATPLSIAEYVSGLIITSMSMLTSIDNAFQRVWKVSKQRPLFNRLCAYWMIITLGPLAASVALGIASSSGRNIVMTARLVAGSSRISSTAQRSLVCSAVS